MKRKNKWMFILTILIAIVLIYLLAFFLPVLKNLNNIKAEVNAKVSESGKEGEQIITEAHLANAIKNARGELTLLKEKIPDGYTKLDIIHSIEKMSRQTGKLNEISLRIIGSESLMEDSVEKQNIEMSFGGSFEEIARFLYDVTHMPHIVTVEDMIISADVKGKINTKMVIACYFRTAKN